MWRSTPSPTTSTMDSANTLGAAAWDLINFLDLASGLLYVAGALTALVGAISLVSSNYCLTYSCRTRRLQKPSVGGIGHWLITSLTAVCLPLLFRAHAAAAHEIREAVHHCPRQWPSLHEATTALMG